MMDDIYLEYMIKRKKDLKQNLLIAFIIIAAAAVSLALFFLMFAAAFAAYNPAAGGSYMGSFIFGIGLVLIAFAWYGAYLLITMQNIEYEYILTNSALDVDKIMSKRGRKSVVGFDFKDIIICASVDDSGHNYDFTHVTPDKTYNVVGDASRGGVYFADFTEDNSRSRVLFQPTSRMLEAARRYNPRKIF